LRYDATSAGGASDHDHIQPIWWNGGLQTGFMDVKETMVEAWDTVCTENGLAGVLQLPPVVLLLPRAMKCAL
jgi:hypothetical protein